jgi:glucosamine--fructose-6-phosphate aminotransferase (isomerizing)
LEEDKALEGLGQGIGIVEKAVCVQCPDKAAYLGGEACLRDLWQQTRELKRGRPFARLLTDQARRAALKELSARLFALARAEQEHFRAEAATLSTADAREMGERLEILLDVAWCLEKELVGSLEKTRALISAPGSPESGSAVLLFRELNSVLSSMDRLEVRGRDSAGVSVLLQMEEGVYDAFDRGLGEAGLLDGFHARLDAPVLKNLSISRARGNGQVSLVFTYKVAAEIGKLGDNVASLRRDIAGDAVFQLAALSPATHHTILAHTRWASVGAITIPNCHPVDNQAEGRGKAPALIQAGLNGDIDNFLEMKQEYETATGLRISPDITTDTKIIPLMIERHLEEGHSVEEAFRMAVRGFTGSHAIFMQCALAPGKLFLAQRGSGQTLFVGLGEESYFPASEVYGFVEETSRFIKLQGEKTVQGVSGKTQGQVFILDQDTGGLPGIRASYYDGTPITLTEKDIQTTRITSRDIDRQDFPHYFLKEITESPDSVARTIQGRWRVEGAGAGARVRMALGENELPQKLRTAFETRAARRAVFIGQGTAGVAAQACADIFRHYTGGPLETVTAMKASEFSGDMAGGSAAPDALAGTLVVAVTQSGTTTDTNRAVDMARARGAWTMAIVNRRDSDITFKVDGVLYTSSGRDIEMSVASTKAFYAQIVAGAILGLSVARLLGARDDSFVAEEIRHLLELPGQMRQVLAMGDKIGAAAKRLAPSKTYWATVGSGFNKAAADEIRIKLSELCYKTISSDFVEDKKHIDLSSEPLILVCAAGSPEAVLSDIVKDVAIFAAHKAAPVVIAGEDENRFDAFAKDVFHVPQAPPHLAPVLSTLAGHIFGYHAALAINDGSAFLFQAREEIRALVEDYAQKGVDVYELLLESGLRERLALFHSQFLEQRRKGRFPSALSGNLMSDLTLLAKYLAGRLPVADFKLDFGVKGTPANMLNTFFSVLSAGVLDMARPVDAIKHQAKTVTVGTSRIAEKVEGHLFDTVVRLGFRVDQITNRNVLVLKNLQEVVSEALGVTVYKVEGLNVLGEPTAESTITVMKKEGTSAAIPSRVETRRMLTGTKNIIVRQGNVYIGKGRKDNRSILVIPLISGAGDAPNTIGHLVLLHVAFKENVPLEKRIKALGGKYEHIRNLVAESSLPWEEGWLDQVPTDELFGRSAEKIAERIAARAREGR